ncbi:diacylglycerol/lipid kinase family protein [Streptacidiphilus melanogenes]|uniref:diacylglycerol/lipid kinase family protein n=1 Tax=Streptacidiphilus melanogenes TaxID=411235 RepID=UPI000AE33558|nr:diacylglycerol kinase family protein [Streptacidiphilus melanogenes]
MPALPTGAGLHIVVNRASGSGAVGRLGRAGNVVDDLRQELPDAHILECQDGGDLAPLLDRAAVLAREADGALGICGGDGSVNLAASVAARENLALVVFPGGTLNHFAIDLGTHTIGSTAQAVRTRSASAVDLGQVVSAGGGSHLFLNTFSIGIYPELVRVRERLEKRWGKWPALAVALVHVMATARPVHVTVSGVPRTLWMLFAGNGTYDPPGFAPSHCSSLDGGQFDIPAIDGSHPFARTRLLLAFLTGTLGTSRVYRAARLPALDITDLSDVESMAVDGETVAAPDRIRLRKATAGLTVYRPDHPATREGAEPQGILLPTAITSWAATARDPGAAAVRSVPGRPAGRTR